MFENFRAVNSHQLLELEEAQLQHGEVGAEEFSHGVKVLLHHLVEAPEGFFFRHLCQECGDEEAHTLDVADFGIDSIVSEQDISH